MSSTPHVKADTTVLPWDILRRFLMYGVQTLLAIRGFSEATVTKIQAAAAKVDKSGSAGMFQTGLQCRVARQKVIKVNHAVHTANAENSSPSPWGATEAPTRIYTSPSTLSAKHCVVILSIGDLHLFVNVYTSPPSSNPLSTISVNIPVPRRKHFAYPRHSLATPKEVRAWTR